MLAWVVRAFFRGTGTPPRSVFVSFLLEAAGKGSSNPIERGMDNRFVRIVSGGGGTFLSGFQEHHGDLGHLLIPDANPGVKVRDSKLRLS